MGEGACRGLLGQSLTLSKPWASSQGDVLHNENLPQLVFSITNILIQLPVRQLQHDGPNLRVLYDKLQLRFKLLVVNGWVCYDIWFVLLARNNISSYNRWQNPMLRTMNKKDQQWPYFLCVLINNFLVNDPQLTVRWTSGVNGVTVVWLVGTDSRTGQGNFCSNRTEVFLFLLTITKKKQWITNKQQVEGGFATAQWKWSFLSKYLGNRPLQSWKLYRFFSVLYLFRVQCS